MIKLSKPLQHIEEAGYNKYLRRDWDRSLDQINRNQLLAPNVDNFTLVNFTWSTNGESANEGNAANEIGFVFYDTTGGQEINKVVRLDFYKPADTIFKFVTLQTVYTNAIHPVTGETAVANIAIYLNPTKTKVTSGTFDYYRFSGGTTIRSGFTATSDQETTTDTFSDTQIKAIQNGWNYLVLQQNTSAGNPGIVAMSLVVTGYVAGTN